MVNTFLTPSVIAREALATLYANTVAAQLVNRDYDGDFAGQVGDTISVRKPAVFAAEDFAGAIVVQDATEGTVPVVLDSHKDVSFAVTSKELTLDIADFATQLLAPAMEALSQQIDSDVIDDLRAVSTAGTNDLVWADADTIVDARAALNTLKAPMSQRYGIWSPAGDANLLKDSLFTTYNESGSTEALTNGGIGRKFGFDHYMDQNQDAATVLGTLFHRNATILASRPLAVPQGAQGAVMGYKGFGLRVVMDYDIDSKTDVVSIDVLYGLAPTGQNTAVTITTV